MAVIDLGELAIDSGADYGQDDDETRRQREAQAAALAAMSDPNRGEDTGLGMLGPRALPSYAESASRVAPQEVAPTYVRRPDRGGAPGRMDPLPAQSAERGQPPASSARLAEQGLRAIRGRDRQPGEVGKSETPTELDRAYDRRRRQDMIGPIAQMASALLGGRGRVEVARQRDPVEEALERQQLAARDRAGKEESAAAQSAAETARRQRDPASPESQRAQELVREMVPGMTDDFYGSVTAADLGENGPIARLMAGRQRGQNQLEIVDRRGEQAVEQIGARAGEERTTEGVRQEGRMDLAEVNNAARLDLQRLRNEVRGRLRRGGGGGGRGGPAAPSVDDLRSAYIDAMREAGTDLSDEQLQLRARSLSPRDLGAVVRAEGTARTGGAERSDISGANAERASQITGYRRRPDAPEISTAERSNLREASATMAALRDPLRRLASIHQRVSAAERAGARADVLGPMMAEARIAHEQAITALRNIGNYGVPQAAELARMESIAPRLESVAGFVSAGNVYPALESALSRQVNDQLAAYGYERAAGGGGQGGDTVRVRHRGRELRVSRANLQRALADGAEVIQ